METSRWRTSIARSVLALGLFGVAAFLWIEFVILRPPAPQPKRAQTPGSYYRITTDLETENQPFRLEVVVKCMGYDLTSSPGGGGNLNYLQLPYLYGLPTPAGHAVLMRVPDFCGLNISNQSRDKARKEELKQAMVLPLIFWAPDKVDLSRMTAYTSLRGYESEGSQLRYVRSSFAEATETEWREWLARNPPFITRPNDPFFQWTGDRRDARPPASLTCFGLWPLPVPDAVLPEVQAAWPSTKPLAWSDLSLLNRLYSLLINPAQRYDDGIILNMMWFLGGSRSGIDVIPYAARSLIGRDEPLARDYPDYANKDVTVLEIDLDSPIRGRAECVHAGIAQLMITQLSIGGERGRTDIRIPFFIRDRFTIDVNTFGIIRAWEGSHEDMYE